MTVRPVTATDLGDWVRMRRELWPHHDAAELRQEAEALFGRDPSMGVFLAERDGELVGFAECSLHECAPGCATTPVGFLEGWYVRPEARRNGVGRTLVNAVADWARERGCRELASDTNTRFPDGPPAHEGVGFVEAKRKIYYRMDLDGN